MKAFYISLSIFVLILFLTLFNSVYTNRVSDELLYVSDMIIDDGAADRSNAEKLNNLWEESKFILELTANHTVTNEIGIKIDRILLFAERSDIIRLEEELQLLRESIGELRRTENFSWENIF